MTARRVMLRRQHDRPRHGMPWRRRVGPVPWRRRVGQGHRSRGLPIDQEIQIQPEMDGDNRQENMPQLAALVGCPQNSCFQLTGKTNSDKRAGHALIFITSPVCSRGIPRTSISSMQFHLTWRLSWGANQCRAMESHLMVVVGSKHEVHDDALEEGHPLSRVLECTGGLVHAVERICEVEVLILLRIDPVHQFVVPATWTRTVS